MIAIIVSLLAIFVTATDKRLIKQLRTNDASNRDAAIVMDIGFSLARRDILHVVNVPIPE